MVLAHYPPPKTKKVIMEVFAQGNRTYGQCEQVPSGGLLVESEVKAY